MPDQSTAAPVAAGPRTVRAPQGSQLSCANWQIEAAFRMIQNNLDPAVAEGSMTEGQREAAESGDLAALVESGVVTLQPIVYEDFLPRSAAGIFASNLTDRGSMDAEQGGAERDAAWMSDVIGAQVHLPEQVYAEQAAASLAAVEHALGRPLR